MPFGGGELSKEGAVSSQVKPSTRCAKNHSFLFFSSFSPLPLSFSCTTSMMESRQKAEGKKERREGGTRIIHTIPKAQRAEPAIEIERGTQDRMISVPSVLVLRFFPYARTH